ncbi:hypothetical protein T11_17325 [Trichinella zimbabwensis]|uniref:Uncharacterized protein n=1 Tax=Trichinella zimbabwensis TaxID=268475 RepID=A0A0V1HLL4_9BILA|nr:hypothetical protein T11_17325 [Trichinella zimbabwensis]
MNRSAYQQLFQLLERICLLSISNFLPFFISSFNGFRSKSLAHKRSDNSLFHVRCYTVRVSISDGALRVLFFFRIQWRLISTHDYQRITVRAKLLRELNHFSPKTVFRVSLMREISCALVESPAGNRYPRVGYITYLFSVSSLLPGFARRPVTIHIFSVMFDQVRPSTVIFAARNSQPKHGDRTKFFSMDQNQAEIRFRL